MRYSYQWLVWLASNQYVRVRVLHSAHPQEVVLPFVLGGCAYSLMVKHVAFNHETEVRFLVGAHPSRVTKLVNVPVLETGFWGFKSPLGYTGSDVIAASRFVKPNVRVQVPSDQTTG